MYISHCRALLPDRQHRNFLEKRQGHCPDKVSETDFSKGVPKSRMWKFASLCRKIVTFATKCVLFAGRGAQSSAVAPPKECKKKIKNYLDESSLDEIWKATGCLKMTPQVTPSSEKGPQKVTLGGIRCHFWAQKLNIVTLLKHCYLP